MSANKFIEACLYPESSGIFEGIHLDNENIGGINCEYNIFKNCSFKNCKFEKMVFRQTIFDSVDFSGSEFIESSLIGITLSDCNCQEIKIRNSICDTVCFNRCNLRHAQIGGGRVREMTTPSSNLYGMRIPLSEAMLGFSYDEAWYMSKYGILMPVAK